MTKSWTPNLEGRDVCTYAAIVEALKSDMASGRLLPGDRLPTHRELAHRLGVAIGTVTRAFREAQRQGLVFGDGRRGTFVGRALEETYEATRGPSEEALIADFRRFIPPTENDPDLAQALHDLARRRGIQHLMRYTCAIGYDYHRAAGARWISGLGTEAGADQVVMTSGAQHSIFSILLAAAETGDLIAADLHTYPGIRFAAEHLRLEIVGIEGDDGGMDPDALVSQCKRQPPRFLYLVPTFQNPTNTVLGADRRHAIAEIAGNYGFDIIEDEINRRLLPDPAPLVKSIVPDRCYLVTTLAKVVAGGLRISYVMPPKGRRDGLLGALHTTALMVSPLLAEIAAVWINDGTADRVIAEKRRELERRNQVAREVLKDFHFRSWPTSYFLWLMLPDGWDPARFEAEAEREHVPVAPASCFALDKERMARAARICLGGATDLDTLGRALTVITDILKRQPGLDSVVL